MAEPRFAGKAAVVTGGANGFGRAVGERLAGDGARVLFVDVSEEVHDVAARVDAVSVVADVSREDDVASYVKRAIEEFGRIDLFFNNAGIEGERGPLAEMSVENFDRVMAVNARGVFLGLRAVLGVMRTSGGGAIVNTASMAGVRGGQNFSPYIASKHAVVGLTRCAAQEGARDGIRCNAVCPGHIDTAMARRLAADAAGDPTAGMARVSATIPLGRYGTAEEVANFSTWLLSDEASYVSGGVFLIDGALNP